jgi:alpha/beta superfamily hydrolase
LESNKSAASPLRASLAGPAGDIEALIEMPRAAPAHAFGVICHPHPLHGGTLTNKVVHTLARSFQELLVPTIRFNFRGVGQSGGRFADGIGETEDALAVIAAGRARWPDAAVWLAGFSFGGAVAYRAAASSGAEFLVTVAPAVRLIDVTASQVPDCPWLIVQGDADELVDPQSVLQWAEKLQPVPTVRLLPGVGHFFHGRLRELQSLVVDFAHERRLARESEKPG